jgi:hypothetical protein
MSIRPVETDRARATAYQYRYESTTVVARGQCMRLFVELVHTQHFIRERLVQIYFCIELSYGKTSLRTVLQADMDYLVQMYIQQSIMHTDGERSWQKLVEGSNLILNYICTLIYINRNLIPATYTVRRVVGHVIWVCPTRMIRATIKEGTNLIFNYMRTSISINILCFET